MLQNTCFILESKKIAVWITIELNNALKTEKDPDILALEKKIAESLGLSVSIDHNENDGGRIEVSYKSLEQLDEVCRRLCLAWRGLLAAGLQ